MYQLVHKVMTKNKVSNIYTLDSLISQEEKNLFFQALADVRPLPGKDKLVVSKRQSTNKHVLKMNKEQGSKLCSYRLALSDNYQPLDASRELSFHRTSDKRMLMELKSAKKLKAQATIDLHGLRLEQAAEELSAALANWVHRGLKVVRIVHGKGKKQGHSVIKSHIPIWLESIPQVLAYNSCRQEDGGTGAVMVLLKKSKKHH